jgi:hypothetical protein
MENQQLTPEQMEEKKKEMMQFYEESMSYLDAQYKYEKVLADIDEVRLKRTQIQMQFAMLAQQSQELEEDEEEFKAPVKPIKEEPKTNSSRKLKKS